jgi:hypothetical protein
MIADHPSEYLDLVPLHERATFGLPIEPPTAS